jgi:dTDP-3-amino-3,4,6-trideoxy-alpha-D-glucose transaminase
MIPFLELKPTYLELREEMDAAYHRVMNSGWYLMGAETEAFETEFAAYVGTRHCVTVGNGLDALRILLEAHGVGPGDEVIVPAHTFIATWLAVSQCGAVPVGVDVHRDSANMDASLLEGALSSRTKAIIPVHLYGQPADMDSILDFAARHGLVVIEDAAQAHGARYKGRMCGTLGHSAAFSFYPGKNLGAFSDGGAVTTDDDDIARRARMLRNYGSEKRYHHDIAGMNSRLDELQAAFLRIKLRHLDDWNARRAAAAERYRQLLTDLSAPFFLPLVPDWAAPVWHLFVIRHPMRELLQKHLEEHGIHTIIHYPIPPHLSRAYQSSATPSSPVAEQLCKQVLSLPCGPHFTTPQIDQCADRIRSFLEVHT